MRMGCQWYRMGEYAKITPSQCYETPELRVVGCGVWSAAGVSCDTEGVEKAAANH